MKPVPPKVYLNGVEGFPAGKLMRFRKAFEISGRGSAVLIISAFSPAKRFQRLEAVGWQEVPTYDLDELMDKALKLLENGQPVWYKSTGHSGGRAKIYTRFDPVPEDILTDMRRISPADLAKKKEAV